MSTCPSCHAPISDDDANFCGACGALVLPSTATAAADPADPFLQRLIGGRYLVQEKIGSGGMGDVYRARHKQVGQQVAIKFLSQRLTTDPLVVQRFFNEARAIARLHHPGAVTLNDFGQTDDGTLYIIMEYIQGEPLSHMINREGRVSSETAVHIALQLCDVLDAAHKQGIIHRDLKPDNIMLTPGRKGRYLVKVLDFGIAKLISEENHLTQTGMVYGTPEFMSPEQATGLPIDPRADLYAVACILYYLLTGRPPFQGDHPMAVMRAQASDTPQRPSVKEPSADVTPALEEVILKALSKSPDARQPSVGALADELERLQLLLSGSIQALSPELRRQHKAMVAAHKPPQEAARPEEAVAAPPKPQKLDLEPPEGPASFGGVLGDQGAPSFDMGLEHDGRAPSFDLGFAGEEHAELLEEEGPGRSALRSSSKGPVLAGAALLLLLLLGAGLYVLSQSGEPEAEQPDLRESPAAPDADSAQELDAEQAEPDAAPAPGEAAQAEPDAGPAQVEPPSPPAPQEPARAEKRPPRKKKPARKATRTTRKAPAKEQQATPKADAVPKKLSDTSDAKATKPKEGPVVPKTLP